MIAQHGKPPKPFFCESSSPGICPLRSAIIEANTTAGDNVIDLPAGFTRRHSRRRTKKRMPEKFSEVMSKGGVTGQFVYIVL
jgi:hypothetical protein